MEKRKGEMPLGDATRVSLEQLFKEGRVSGIWSQIRPPLIFVSVRIDLIR